MIEKMLLFEYPMSRFGCFFMSQKSFDEYLKETPNFESLLRIKSIVYKILSSDFIKFEYNR